MKFAPIGREAQDVPFLPAGPGLSSLRTCMGCDGKRQILGGRGLGVRWRCAGCVSRRVVRAAA